MYVFSLFYIRGIPRGLKHFTSGWRVVINCEETLGTENLQPLIVAVGRIPADVDGSDGSGAECEVAHEVVEVPVSPNLRNLAVGDAHHHVRELAQHPTHLINLES